MGELNPKVVGKTYEPQTLEVTAEATKAYAMATNDDNPWYVDESRDGGLIAPPLFAMVPGGQLLLASMMDPEIQVPVDRTLHGEQDMYFESPIRPGDTLTSEAKILAIEERSTGETLTTEIVSRAADGTVRCRQLLTAFIRSKDRRGPRTAEAAPERGAPIAEAVMKVTEDQSYRYAEASGDHNPPHVNEEFAKMIGFRTVILQGLCTMAFTSKAVIDELCDGDPTRLKRLKVRFSKPVYPGDVLTTRIWRADAAYAFETVNQDGVHVIKDGVAEIV